MAPINTIELSYLLNSRLAVYTLNHNSENDRLRVIDYAKMFDKFMANPSVFSGLDGQPADAPDNARQVKKAKFGLSPNRMNNENSAPNPRVMAPARFMSPIAENGDNSKPRQCDAALVNPPSAHQIDKSVQSMTVAKLRRELKKRGKETNGLKRDLQSRLAQAMREKHRQEASIMQASLQQEVVATTSDVPNEIVEETVIVNSTNSNPPDKQLELGVPNEITLQATGSQKDVEMGKEEAVDTTGAPVNNEAEAMDRQVDLSLASSISQDLMDAQLNESIAKVALEENQPSPRSGSDERKSTDDFASNNLLEQHILSHDSPMGTYSDVMEIEETNDPLIVVESQISYSPRHDVSSKVMEFGETVERPAKLMSKPDLSQKKATFAADPQLPASPMSISKPEEDEKSKQVLLSLKKLNKTPSYKASETETKPERVAASSAYKVSSLALLRSEQKASLKVHNAGGETFLVNTANTAPLGHAITSKMAADESRRARLAEMRGKSKPVAVTKAMEAPNPISKVFSSLKSKAASTLDFADQKKKQLAAQMREKTAQKKEKAEPIFELTTIVEQVPVTTSYQKNHEEKFLLQKNAVEPVTNGTPLSSVIQAFSAHTKPTATVQRIEQHQQSEPASSAKKKHAPNHHGRDDLNIFSPMSTYEISDREHSDSEEEESEDEDENPAKKIPKWARKEHLEPALMKQFHDNRLDPDEIFRHGIATCDLEAIFDKKKSKFRKRTSSGNWTKDRVTPAEQLAYRSTMGYKNAK